MCADNQRGPAVCKMTHGVFLAGGFSVHVDHGCIASHAQRAGFQFAIGCGKRIVHRVHEYPAHQVHHQDARAVPAFKQIGAASGCAMGIICGPDQAWLALNEDECFLLVPGMIAQGHAICAGLEEFVADLFGNAETAGCVLAVDDRRNRAASAGAGRAGVRASLSRPVRPTISPMKRRRRDIGC